MVDNKKLWDDCLVDIELNISKANFGTWFRNTRIVKQDTGIIYLGVPNAFVKDWLYTKFHKFILRSLRILQPEVRTLQYLIVRNDDVDKYNPAPAVAKPAFANQ